MQGAVEGGDLQEPDAHTRRSGWLASSAGRAWREVREEQVGSDSGILEAELEVRRFGLDRGPG